MCVVLVVKGGRGSTGEGQQGGGAAGEGGGGACIDPWYLHTGEDHWGCTCGYGSSKDLRGWGGGGERSRGAKEGGDCIHVCTTQRATGGGACVSVECVQGQAHKRQDTGRLDA
jgi:hypothetical protein